MKSPEIFSFLGYCRKCDLDDRDIICDMQSGDIQVASCIGCGYNYRLDLAQEQYDIYLDRVEKFNRDLEEDAKDGLIER